MNTSTLSITKSVSREIPLNKLVPAPDNVRKTPREGMVAERAASIEAHGLLHNLTVRPELDEDGRETGKYEVTAGCTRLAALKLLASRKKIAKNAPIPCNVREDGLGTELSLAENIEREPLHPADEFEAFRDLQDKSGLGMDSIAARFGVTPRLVKERLRLGAVNPDLIDLYRQGAMTLEQLMAFTVTDDHVRQQYVWANLTFDKSPVRVRRTLLESHVPANDRRARFVSLAAYEAAGGVIVRDLFSEDDGGYLADADLLDRLVRMKLAEATEAPRSEGWKWVEAAIDFPHNHGLARVYPRDVELASDETERLDEIEAELDPLYAALEQADEPDPELERQIASLTAEFDEIEGKQRVYEPGDFARAGAFVCIGQNGSAEIVRGYVRPEDMPNEQSSSAGASESSGAAEEQDDEAAGHEVEEPARLSGALIADLSAHRTMALRDALATRPNIALAAITHVLALDCFYLGASAHSCLRISAHRTQLETSAPGIAGSMSGCNVEVRQEAWAARLPTEPGNLWAFILALSAEECLSLLAHCLSFAVDAVETGAHTRQALAHSELVAQSVALDMRGIWIPTVASYLGRVPKTLIQDAVSEAISPDAAQRIAGLKKADMASAAEDLLKTTGWLPKSLRPHTQTMAKSGPAAHIDLQQAAE
jgi:ParB family chromosome partitioning protein